MGAPAKPHPRTNRPILILILILICNLNPPSSPAAAPVVLPPKSLPVAGPVPPEILAVIAAAVSVVLGRAHRVVSVQQSPTPEMNVWALEGRMKQFMSHKVR